jgi:hypothetical protein
LFLVQSGLHEGRQFSRSGCASTPAFGRKVRAFRPDLYGMAEAMPLTKQCHRKRFAQSDFIPEAIG